MPVSSVLSLTKGFHPHLLSWLVLFTLTFPSALAEEPAPILNKNSAKERLRELREHREQAREYQLQHQESVRRLESMGCELDYELKEDLSEYAPVETPETVYITNSLGDEILIPVTRIWANSSQEKLKEFSVELLLPFTHLKFVDLACCELTLEDVKQLQEFPELEYVILPKKLIDEHTQEKIQALLPHCKLEFNKYYLPGEFGEPILTY